MAANAKDEDEVTEALPMPVAEKLIGHKRRNNLDTLRDQMIGMIFTGKPQPLVTQILNFQEAHIISFIISSNLLIVSEFDSTTRPIHPKVSLSIILSGIQCMKANLLQAYFSLNFRFKL